MRTKATKYRAQAAHINHIKSSYWRRAKAHARAVRCACKQKVPAMPQHADMYVCCVLGGGGDPILRYTACARWACMHR